MLNRSVGVALGLALAICGAFDTAVAASDAPLQLDALAPADLLIYVPDTGAWINATYDPAAADGFAFKSGFWAPGLTVMTARLNDDELADAVLYQATTGAFGLAFNTGAGYRISPSALTVGWEIFRADFNGDRLDDLLLYSSETGRWVQGINDGLGGFTAYESAGPPNQQILILDFTGDGRSDVLTYDALAGRIGLHVGAQSGAGFSAELWTSWSAGWQIRRARWNVDSLDDLFLYQSETGAWAQAIATGDARAFTFHSGAWTTGWDARIMEANGDGVSDVLLYNGASGTWYLALARPGGEGFASYFRGSWPAGATLHVTDVDRDGRSDVLIHQASQGEYGLGITIGDGLFQYQTGGWAVGGLVASQLGDRLIPSAPVHTEPPSQAPNPSGRPEPPPTAPAPRIITTTPKIVAFGDSITAGTPSEFTAIFDADHVTYPGQLASLMSARYPQQITRVTNSGIPGELTLQGKDRIGAVLDFFKPNLVLILEGINDINAGRSNSETAQSLQTMVQRAQVRGVRVLLARLTPVTSDFDPTGDISSLIDDLNDRIDVVAARMGLGEAVDLHTALTDERVIGPDGLHPSDEGYERIGDVFFDAIVERFETIARPVIANVQD